MSYSTILVHVDQSKHSAARVKIAAQIAIAENAHLIGAAMTRSDAFIFRAGGLDRNGQALISEFDRAKERATQSLIEFEAIAKQLGVLSFERRLVDDRPEEGLCLQARYADLVVVGQGDPDHPSVDSPADLPENVMLNCPRPVLIIPYAGRFDEIGANALIAWDASMEATRAVTDSLPLLKRARSVTVAVFNPVVKTGAHGEEPGADIALFLARHGIKVKVAQRSVDIEVGEALLSMAAEMQSELIVMGGYGHKRFRELLLGGVTRTVLRTMTAPVLMSH